MKPIKKDKQLKNNYSRKIEDEYDIALADAALREYENNSKTYTHEEIKKMLNL